MTKEFILIILLLYFALLLLVSYYTSRNANNQTFFAANKNASWYLVAFGMVGTSLSGITFISVPGTVGSAHFNYFQVVIGYFIGYFAVAFILLPLYYRLGLTSIYNYLLGRFGMYSYKTGSLLFIVSRTLGATLRLYLVINVLQSFILEDMHVPFWVTAVAILLMILLYTFKGGVKTIVWTDTLQTFFMLLALVVCVYYIMSNLGLSLSSAMSQLSDGGYTQIFNTDPMQKGYFLKQIIGGAFITISMTGLDQEMMQKNISVKTLGDSQKNMVTFSFTLVLVNFLFLLLGGLLYLFATSKGLDLKGDDIFPTVAMNYLPGFVSVIFVVGLISALFPSADGAITALTSSFCLDLLGMDRNKMDSEKKKKQTRMIVHLSFAVLFLLFVFMFKLIDNKSIVNILLDIASYTYGPLLGLFAFGILTKRDVNDIITPVICLVAPALAYTLNAFSEQLLGGYKFGFELLAVNGALTFLGLFIFSSKIKSENSGVLDALKS
jgi:Na+/proline symporter